MSLDDIDIIAGGKERKVERFNDNEEDKARKSLDFITINTEGIAINI